MEFSAEYLQKPWFVTSSRFVITIYCFVAKYTYYMPKMVKI